MSVENHMEQMESELIIELFAASLDNFLDFNDWIEKNTSGRVREYLQALM